MTIRKLSAESAAAKPKAKRAVVFDLDGVLIDSSSAEPLLQARRWGDVYASIPRLPPYKGVEALLKVLRAGGILVGVATARPPRFAELVIKRWKFPVDAVGASFEACGVKLGASAENTVAVCLDPRKAPGLFTAVADWSGKGQPGGRIRCASVADLEMLLKRLLQL